MENQFRIEAIRHYARYERVRSDALPRERLDYFDVTCVTKGYLDYQFNDEPRRVNAGDIIVFPPGSVRERKASNEYSAYMSLNFFPADNSGAFPYAGLFPGTLSPRILNLCDLFFGSLSPYREEKQSALLSLILVELAGAILSQSTESPYTTRLKEYIQTHLPDPLPLAALANLVHLNPSYCCQIFKRDTGITLSDYISQKRVELAKNYLLSPTIRLSDLPALCGFSDYKYFSKTFKRVSNLSPLAYRKM